MTTARSYELIANLPLVIERYELEPRERRISPEFERLTTIVHLRGAGEEGLGEDVVYDPRAHRAQWEAGPALELAGEWTLGAFSAQLDQIDTFHGADPGFPVYRDYRRWAYESAALDLALRQAGKPLHAVLGGEPRPARFVVSIRIPDPSDLTPVLDRMAAYGGVRFKLDPQPDWDEAVLAALAETQAVDVFDFKGAYKGTPVDVETDPTLYRRVAEAFPQAWLEDPDLTVPEADAALAPHRDRITWDAPIHSVDDVRALPFPPRTLNVKPSRFGSLERLLDFIDHCSEQGIGLYGGGQAELGVGRGQLHVLASIFHPDASNDIAPAGWDHSDWPRTGLPTSPLDPSPEPTGFRRTGVL